MIRYTRACLLSSRHAVAAAEAPEELLNSGIGVLAKDDDEGTAINPESLVNYARQEFDSVIGKKGDVRMHSCLTGVLSLKDRDLQICGRMNMSLNWQAILSKLEISMDYAPMARQLRQEGILNEQTLRGVISLIFENAAMHPKQCDTYSQLCLHLSNEQPKVAGEKSITFRSALLRGCQELFHGNGALRVEITNLKRTTVSLVPAVERDAQSQKTVKSGKIILIGELFKQKLLPESIVHECIQELLGHDSHTLPPEEHVEALCRLFRTLGKQLEDSATTSKAALDTYFARLRVVRESSAPPSRIQSMVRDVLRRRSIKWVTPEEEMKTKKKDKAIANTAARSGIQLKVAARRMSEQLPCQNLRCTTTSTGDF